VGEMRAIVVAKNANDATDLTPTSENVYMENCIH
jgi:hypothetical protein